MRGGQKSSERKGQEERKNKSIGRIRGAEEMRLEEKRGEEYMRGYTKGGEN